MRIRFLPLLPCMIALCAPLGASGSREIEEGNRAFRAGRYDAALAAYGKASVKDPESPYVRFNEGAVYFRQENWEKAKEAFQQAALKTKDLRFEAKAHFNLGNCSFREAERQSESDLQKAVDAYQAAVSSYQKAYQLDPTLQDAVHNIEVTRIILKDLLDRLRKQQEEQKKNQDLYKDVVEKLKSLITRQGAEIEDNRRIGAEEAKSGRTATVSRDMENMAADQDSTRSGTKDLLAETRDIMAKNPPAQGAAPQGAPAPESGPEAAAAHMEKSYAQQTDAVQEARAKNLAGALPFQEKSLDELNAALKALTGEEQGQDQQQQQQGQQDKKQEQQEQQSQQAQDARRIIEDENQRDRQGDAQAAGGYRDVDKDW